MVIVECLLKVVPANILHKTHIDTTHLKTIIIAFIELMHDKVIIVK